MNILKKAILLLVLSASISSYGLETKKVYIQAEVDTKEIINTPLMYMMGVTLPNQLVIELEGSEGKLKKKCNLAGHFLIYSVESSGFFGTSTTYDFGSSDKESTLKLVKLAEQIAVKKENADVDLLVEAANPESDLQSDSQLLIDGITALCSQY